VAALELNIFLLCFTTAVCAYALISKSHSDWNAEKIFVKNKTYFIVAACVLALAVIVRVWNFGGVPSGANQDEAMAAVDANALAHYGTDRFGMSMPVYFTAWGYGQMSVLLSYCMVPFIKIFGLSMTTVRMPMLLASLAGCWVLFRFAEKLFGRAPALLVLIFAAINPWQIMQSRWALDCNLFPHFLLFSMYFLYHGLDKRVYLYLSMVFFALAMYSYGIAFYTVPLLLVVLCIYLVVKKRIKIWEAAICAATYLLIAWPSLAVVLINTFKWKTLHLGPVTIAYFPDSIRMNDLLIYSKDFLNQLSSNIQSFFNVAFLEKGDFNWNYIPDYGRMYLFSLPFIIMGLIWLAKRRKQPDPGQIESAESRALQTGRFFLLTWLAVAAFSGLMVDNVNTNRINLIFYPVLMLAGLGLWHVLFEAAKVRKLVIAVAVLYAISFTGFTASYFGNHAKALANDFCSGLTDAVKYADGLNTDVLYITADSRSRQAYTCSEIYTMLGADIDAHYYQGKAPAYSKDGKKLLPYQERYKYTNFMAFNFDQPAGSVYVFNMQDRDEASQFAPGTYQIRQFGNFGVAVRTADVQPDNDNNDADNDYDDPNQPAGSGDLSPAG
jgi:4-amino-4-deoxy-L-arabinose transferase-like glycosyltransferase